MKLKNISLLLAGAALTTVLSSTAMAASWPNNALVGYVAAYNTPSTANPDVTDSMITSAIDNHYNVFVYAFGAINSSNQVTMPASFVSPGKLTSTDLINQINAIHAQKGIAILSFGGQNNTFAPGSDPVAAADATVAALTVSNGSSSATFDGVDLDLESVSVSASYIEQYMTELRAKDPGIIITAAPQIAGGYGGPATFAPALFATSDFLQSANFTALLVQDYNQGAGASFNGLTDTDKGFISASFDALTKIVPSSTKIVPGEPANSSAGTGLSSPSDIVSDITTGKLTSNSQYGGIMTWAINYDSTQNWSFANGVYQAA